VRFADGDIDKIMLADLGHAKNYNPDENTWGKTRVGTHFYRAPEVSIVDLRTGTPKYGPGVDVFSCGKTLQIIRAGYQFRNRRNYNFWDRKWNIDKVPLDVKNGDVIAMTMKMVKVDPKKRPTVEELIEYFSHSSRFEVGDLSKARRMYLLQAIELTKKPNVSDRFSELRERLESQGDVDSKSKGDEFPTMTKALDELNNEKAEKAFHKKEHTKFKRGYEKVWKQKVALEEEVRKLKEEKTELKAKWEKAKRIVDIAFV